MKGRKVSLRHITNTNKDENTMDNTHVVKFLLLLALPDKHLP